MKQHWNDFTEAQVKCRNEDCKVSKKQNIAQCHFLGTLTKQEKSHSTSNFKRNNVSLECSIRKGFLHCQTASCEPLTYVSSLIHWHWQLDDVIHPLRVFGFLWLLTHNPLLHQESESLGRVGTRATIPLWVKWNNDIIKKAEGWRQKWNTTIALPPPCLQSAKKTPEHPVVDW